MIKTAMTEKEPQSELQRALDSETLDRLFRARHSCRGFRPEPVDQAVIERILEISQRTASWCNTQPWRLEITSGAATDDFRRMLLEKAHGEAGGRDIQPGPEYHGIYLQRRRECGFVLYESVGVTRGDRVGSAKQALENFRLFDAPHVAIISTDRALGPYGAIDCGAYVSSFLLVAQSFGVATIPQAALAMHSALIRSYFNMTEDRQIVCGISFGYENTDHPANNFRTQRDPIDSVVTWHR